jgi:replicative DNA helicase
MNNVAAEKILLAGIAAYPTKLFDYVDYLSADDFTHSACQMTFDSLRSLIVEREVHKITKAKLVATAKDLGFGNFLSATKNGEWIDEILNESMSENEVDAHFMAVKRQSLIRGYSKALDEVRGYLKDTTDPISQMIGKVEDTIVSKVSMLDHGESDAIPLTKDIWKFIDHLKDDPGHIGVDLGYPVWQERAGQIRNGAVTFWVATAKAGKSQFALAAALKTAYRLGLPVLLLDSELNEHDQKIRLVGMMAKVPYQFIETGFWAMNPSQLRERGVTDEQTIQQIQDAAERMRDPELRRRVEELPITYQSISGMDMPDIIPHIRRWLLTKVKPDRHTTLPQCLIVLDYIKLATLDNIRRGIAEWQQHGVNVAELHNLMKKYNVPCLAFGQTNNELDDGFRCVAGGKRITENVTSISYLKKKTADERSFDGEGTHLVKVFGTRYGSGTGDTHINFAVDLSIGEFREIGLSAINIDAARSQRLQEWKDSKNKQDDHDE